MEADLHNEEILGEGPKFYNIIKQLRPLLEVICAADKLQWIVLEQSLVSHFVLIRQAKNFC